MTRPAAFARVALVYVVAIAVAGAVAVALGDQPPLVVVLVADVVATGVVFASSRWFDNSSLYDAYWSVAPLLVAPFLALHPDASGDVLRQALVVLLVWAWGLRLTGNWARGWAGLDHEDWRYVHFRQTTGRWYWLVSFAGIHLFPTLQVFLGCLALHPALVSGTRPAGPLDLLAFAVTAGAIALETVADDQLRAFRARRPPPGAILDSGVWSWLRHPNYLGELGFWWGLWVFGVAARPDAWWWTLTGPLAMTLMFATVSIPLIDKRHQERRPGYAEHMRRVPALLPRPWRRRTADTT